MSLSSPFSSSDNDSQLHLRLSAWPTVAKSIDASSLNSNLLEMNSFHSFASFDAWSTAPSQPLVLPLNLPFITWMIVIAVFSFIALKLRRQTVIRALNFLYESIYCQTVDFISFYVFHRRPVYLLCKSLYDAPREWYVSPERFRRIAGVNFNLPSTSVDFCCRLLEKSGLGPETTSFPPGIIREPVPDIGMAAARQEAIDVMTGVCDDVFNRCSSFLIPRRDIDAVIVNCSLFVPTPSLAAMIMNHYRLRPDCETYNLGGQGCSGAAISIGCAKRILESRRNSTILVISTENITQNIYLGRERGMLISNSLFRVGGAAILLSNKYIDIAAIDSIPTTVSSSTDLTSPSADSKFRRVEYELEALQRTCLAASDDAYNCVVQDVDSEGHKGVRLSPALPSIAGKALAINVAALAPRALLTWTEMAKCAINIVARQAEKMIRNAIAKRQQKAQRSNQVNPISETELQSTLDSASTAVDKSSNRVTVDSKSAASSSTTAKPELLIGEYVPRFNRRISHFCVHAGGASVLNAIQSGLHLSDKEMEPSRATLYKYGNTSSSSVWYELRESEGEKDDKIKAGQRVWQMGFGSGFKANSMVWRRVSKAKPQSARQIRIQA